MPTATWNEDRSEVTLSFGTHGFRLSETEAADLAHLLRTGGEDTNTLTTTYRVDRTKTGFRITAFGIAWADVTEEEARFVIHHLQTGLHEDYGRD